MLGRRSGFGIGVLRDGDFVHIKKKQYLCSMNQETGRVLQGMSQATYPLLIVGPCSAETESQVFSTAQAIQRIAQQSAPHTIYRAGIWKPRTNPAAFAGVGERGLAWLQRVQTELGLPVATEVATAEHVRLCVAAGIHHLWIGARTTANPIMLQSIADSLRPYADRDLTIYVKNPINPDIALWVGAIERLQNAGISQIVAVHRGFSTLYNNSWRNAPMWSVPIELRRRYPSLPLICDPSHIAGEASRVPTIATEALLIGFDGLMVECHFEPSQALSDAAQQLSPDALEHLLATLPTIEHREASAADTTLLALRQQIDEIDDALWQLIAERLRVAQEIGEHKRQHHLPVLQSTRYEEIVQKRVAWGKDNGISEETIRQLMELLHAESINRQL